MLALNLYGWLIRISPWDEIGHVLDFERSLRYSEFSIFGEYRSRIELSFRSLHHFPLPDREIRNG